MAFLTVLAEVVAVQWGDIAPAVYVFAIGLVIYFLGHLSRAVWMDAVSLRRFVEGEGFLPVEDHLKIDQLRSRVGLIWYELNGEKMQPDHRVAQGEVPSQGV